MALNGNTIPYVPPAADQAQQIRAVNQIIDNINAGRQLSVTSDDVTSRYLNGFQKNGWPDGDFGMKISRPGISVTDATLDQLLFYWDYTSNKQYWNNPTTGATYMTIGSDGMKIAKAGFDAKTAGDENLSFNSSQNVFKIVASGTVNLNRPAGTATVSTSIPTPVGGAAFFSWGTLIASPSLTYPLPYYAPNGTGGILWGVRAYYDSATGSVRFFHESYDAGVTASAYNLTIKYYILQETAV